MSYFPLAFQQKQFPTGINVSMLQYKHTFFVPIDAQFAHGHYVFAFAGLQWQQMSIRKEGSSFQYDKVSLVNTVCKHKCISHRHHDKSNPLALTKFVDTEHE